MKRLLESLPQLLVGALLGAIATLLSVNLTIDQAVAQASETQEVAVTDVSDPLTASNDERKKWLKYATNNLVGCGEVLSTGGTFAHVLVNGQQYLIHTTDGEYRQGDSVLVFDDVKEEAATSSMAFPSWRCSAL